MKKLLLLIVLTFLFNCGRSSDDPVVPPANTNIPKSFIGKWVVYEYKSITDNGIGGSSTTGLPYYIKFNSDNTIEVKGVQANFTGNAIASESLQNANFTVKNNTAYSLIITADKDKGDGKSIMNVYYEPNSPESFNYIYTVKKQ